MLLLAAGGFASGESPSKAGPVLHVGPSAKYKTVEEAVEALPDTGGTVLIAPGTYRGQVIVNESHVTFRGEGSDPAATVIVDDTSQGTRGTKPSYATVHVLGDEFHAVNLTFQNDFNRTHAQVFAGSQAQALNLEGDRNVLDHVAILGNQDTLYIGAKGCGQSGSLRRPPPSSTSFPPSATPAPVKEASPCIPKATRSYFTHCVVAGNVDFIYGDGIAYFEDCEIHSTTHAAGGYLTAQGKYLADQNSVFVFDHCKLTADAGQMHVFLGRPWRPYASVVFLNCEMGAQIEPAGWREWHPGETHSLETAFYAEYHSTGPGADASAREPNSHQLTEEQAKAYSEKAVLGGWDPKK